MIVLATSATAVATTRSAFRDQHYNQLAKEATESGILMAEECINERAIVWNDPLRPGGVLATDWHRSAVALIAIWCTIPTKVYGRLFRFMLFRVQPE